MAPSIEKTSGESIANNFRRWGYLAADVDPLGFFKPATHRDIENAKGAEAERFKKIYCGKVGTEFMHMPIPERCDWLAERLEGPTPEYDKRHVLERLHSAERFENFIHTKYVGAKWFSLEGLTSLIPMLDMVISQAAEQGVERILIGMAHRGRLSALYHITGVESAAIFAKFEDHDPRSALGSGDTKYHKGATGTYKTLSGKEVRVHLASNPSHLEQVNAVILGRSKARQDRIEDHQGKKILPIIIHGDAALAGQGTAAECFNYATMDGFAVGGTVHIVANNLIGFTARPHALHSSRYATDIAKRLPIPIFHVNAESLDDVVKIGTLATEYRMNFASDVMIDLIGFRRFGHNEVDDPSPTAPVLYQKIKEHPLIHETYAKEIGVEPAELKQMDEKLLAHFREEHERGVAMNKAPHFAELPKYWHSYVGGFYEPSFEVPTAVDVATLQEIGKKITSYPADFNIHPKIKKGMEQRQEMYDGKRPIDWGAAEALALGSLLQEGTPVRITGQDSRRATFSHRHAVFYDTKTEQCFIPLSNLSPSQAKFQIYDSVLSEAAAVGFEYGYARDYPETLVCWEAQFGDFVNGAQVYIDQFLSSGEDKWQLLSGIVLLLPHGFEGQGPEHSSARIERFLQLCAEDNMQVVYPSNSAQYFHLLRRQVLRKWRKPLIVATPKSALRLPAACSQLADLASGQFKNVIDDLEAFKNAEKIILCSGKIVHELRAERAKAQHDDTAIVTVEQLYPFPEEELAQVIGSYAQARTIVWVQEEPANMGALSFVKPYLDRIAGDLSVTSVKRSASASPATGSAKAHALEQEAIIKFAFAKYR